jgi:hypothetical protein
MKKKFVGMIILIATAILSGVALNKFLNWAGQQEIFDFDLNEDIDEESFETSYLVSIGHNAYI